VFLQFILEVINILSSQREVIYLATGYNLEQSSLATRRIFKNIFHFQLFRKSKEDKVLLLSENTYSNQPVNVTSFLLAISPHSGHGLVIIGRVPVRVKHH